MFSSTTDDTVMHQGSPYCYKPCYGVLFGPNIYLNGVTSGEAQNIPVNRAARVNFPEDQTSHARRTNGVPLDSTVQSSLNQTEVTGYLSVRVNGASNSEVIRSQSTERISRDNTASRSSTINRKPVYSAELTNHSQTENLSFSTNSSRIEVKEAADMSSPSHWKSMDATHQRKLKVYNDFYADQKTLQLRTIEKSGKQVLEGQLRIHWGIHYPIHFKQKDDSSATPTILSPTNDSPDFFLQDGSFDDSDRMTVSPVVNRASNLLPDMTASMTLPSRNSARNIQSMYGSVMLRGESRGGGSGSGDAKLRRVRKRQSILNGHVYNAETSMFIPTYDSISSVTVTSLDTTPEVIRLLLEKYKVVNIPQCYSLCFVRSNGEAQTFKDIQFPLMERLLRGPNEDENKIFIMEKHRAADISIEVAQFISLPEPMLCGFLEKLKKDEEYELAILQERYKNCKKKIQECLSHFSESYL